MKIRKKKTGGVPVFEVGLTRKGRSQKLVIAEDWREYLQRIPEDHRMPIAVVLQAVSDLKSLAGYSLKDPAYDKRRKAREWIDAKIFLDFGNHECFSCGVLTSSYDLCYSVTTAEAGTGWICRECKGDHDVEGKDEDIFSFRNFCKRYGISFSYCQRKFASLVNTENKKGETNV